MTVGKSDPHYGAALEAVEKATAAVSGTNPVNGQPYAPGYAGLPTEITELQKRLVANSEEAQEVSYWLVADCNQGNQEIRIDCKAFAPRTAGTAERRQQTFQRRQPLGNRIKAPQQRHRSARGRCRLASRRCVATRRRGHISGRKPLLRLSALRTPSVGPKSRQRPGDLRPLDAQEQNHQGPPTDSGVV